MKQIDVVLQQNAYKIIIDTGAIRRVGEYLANAGLTRNTMVVTDQRVGSIYGGLVMDSLRAAGIKATLHSVPVGERSKSLARLRWLYDQALDCGLDRAGQVLALGGGVVGDLAGFFASTFLRGVRLVQVPTTLLAQVDSSVGGKTGVNLPRGKNLVGTFCQPDLVLVDPAVLHSLSPRHYRAGWAEVAKYGFIGDIGLVELLEDGITAIDERDPDMLTRCVARSCDHKRRIVEADEKENGIRTHLNYGHTFGHAVEVASGFEFLHGEAVALGITASVRLARSLGLDPQAERQIGLLQRLGLPTVYAGIDIDSVLDRLRYDKKVRDGRLRFVLTPALGQARIVDDAPDHLVRQAVASLRKA